MRLRTWVHPLHSVREAISAIVIVDSQRPGDNAWVCRRHGSVCVDVVSSPARVHDHGMRSSKGRPAGNEVDELGETEHVGDSRKRNIVSMLVSFSFVSGARCRYRKSRSKPAACGGGGHQHLWDLMATPCATTPDSKMRTPHANGTLQRARSFCARWLARHCMSPTVSAIVSGLARIGFKVAYWLDRGTRPTSGGMHLALPPPRRPGQIAHAEKDGGARSDSLRLCDGLAASAGLSAAGLLVCAKRPC